MYLIVINILIITSTIHKECLSTHFYSLISLLKARPLKDGIKGFEWFQGQVEEKQGKDHEASWATSRISVITAHGTGNMLLSIPITTQLEFDVVDATLRGIAPVLPAIFTRTNVTWCMTDVTQCRLPENLCALPQPLEGVLEEWIKSYEGAVQSD